MSIPGWNGRDANESVVKNHFITTLQPGICRWVQNSEPATFEDAVTETVKQEMREQQCFGILNPAAMAMISLATQNPSVAHLAN